jgi:hypothetical protein
MKLQRILLIAALFLTHLPGGLGAQDEASIYAGDTIRATTVGIGNWLNGVLVSLDSECVVIARQGGHEPDLVLSRATIRRLEVKRGLRWVPVPLETVSMGSPLPTPTSPELYSILREGEVVRLTRRENAEEWLEGMVVSRQLDRVVLVSEDQGAETAILLDSIGGLQIRRQKTKAGKGAVTGGLIGMLPGAVAGGGFCALAAGLSGGGGGGCVGAAMGGALFVGVLGAGIGALIGSTSKVEVWEPVTLERLSISAGPTGELAVGLSIRLGRSSRFHRPAGGTERRRG